MIYELRLDRNQIEKNMHLHYRLFRVTSWHQYIHLNWVMISHYK